MDTATHTIIEHLPADPRNRHRALGQLLADINGAMRDTERELHVLAVGDRECPVADRCDVHGMRGVA